MLTLTPLWRLRSAVEPASLIKSSWVNMYEMLGTQYIMQAEGLAPHSPFTKSLSDMRERESSGRMDGVLIIVLSASSLPPLRGLVVTIQRLAVLPPPSTAFYTQQPGVNSSSSLLLLTRSHYIALVVLELAM